ncbi:MAG: PAS domain-containing protein, partial [Acidimicrobiia bacterium]
MASWPSVRNQHLLYVRVSMWLAATLGAAYGLIGSVSGDPSLLWSSLALFAIAILARRQLRQREPRLEILVGLGGVVLIAAALVRDPAVLVAALLAYAMFAAAATYLGGRLWSLWFGLVILVAGSITIVKTEPSVESLALAVTVLVFGNGVGGLLHTRTGELLRVESARREAVFDTAPDGIVIVDEGGRILEVNDKFLEMFALEPSDDITGLTI